MKTIVWAVGSLGLAMLVLVTVSSRHIGELFGYVKATADQTVDGLEESVPHAIRDQKLQNDIEHARGDIIDRRVKLNLAASEIRRMQQEIDELTAATQRRETILTEAYPALEAAAADRVHQVAFAGTQWLPTELGAEIDRLLMEQDRDERQLAKTTAEESLQRTDGMLAAKVAEVAALRTASGTGGHNGVVVQVSASLAAIESRLADATFVRDSAAAAAVTAREHLADALEQYDRAVQARQSALAQKWKPTSSKVKAIDGTITQAEATLRSGLKSLDRPLGQQFEALHALVTSAESDYQRILLDVLPEHADAVKLKRRIDDLKSQQHEYHAAHKRLNGDAAVQSDELLNVCRHQVQELLRQRQTGKFERLRREGTFPTAANMETVPIAAGSFMMGSNNCSVDEKPVRKVTISKPFFAGRYEVTVGQILTWLNSSGVSFREEWMDLSSEYCPVRKLGSRFVLNTGTEFGKSEQQPMCVISQIGAKAFCQWCSQQDSRFTYRLPTEAEWEYMARAGSTTEYPWGDSCNGTEANVDGQNPHGTSSKGAYLRTTTPVGAYRPNAWGLYDTAGNVYEWCSDFWNSDYYKNSPGVDPQGPGSGSSVVCRGGCWDLYAISGRTGYRNYRTAGRHGRTIGFRVVAE